MNRISVLDCTLRDGGYINDFHFGYAVMKDIIDKLSKACVDIIECGFLKSGAYDRDDSLFGNVEVIKELITKKYPGRMYVAMLQYGAMMSEEISRCEHDSIDGIRITFHEHEMDGAFVLAEELMHKGYKIFMQPVGTTTYSDQKLLKLIESMNNLKPYAFYIVDTLGMMYKNDLLRMYDLIDRNLDDMISIGFHSHNNLQLSFSNAQQLIDLNSARQIIIDSSIYGLGRGAGNLNTELITQYINSNFGFQYENIEILEIIDEYIRPMRMIYSWGYDAAYYIASTAGCHPNYASFLLNKQTLHVQNIYAILNRLDRQKRALYDEKYISREYIKYMNHYVDDTDSVAYVRKKISGKQIIVLAPGKSLKDHTDKINRMLQEDDYYVASVNFIPDSIKCDMVYVSNMKRLKGIENLLKQISVETDVIVTSNIRTASCGRVHVIDYMSYSNEELSIIDNAGLMCINFLKKTGADSVMLAGFDGFSSNRSQNYYDQTLLVDVDLERLRQMNAAAAKKIAQLKRQMKIEFLTDTFYE